MGKLIHTDVSPLRNNQRGGMVRSILIAVGIAETIVIAMIMLAAFFCSAAQSAELGSEPTLLAYADPASGSDFADPFGDVFMDDHELNDAWMGMPVVTIDGDLAGYVSDAVMDADGYVDLIVISPTPDGALREPKILSASFVILGAVDIVADMTLNTLRAQGSAEEYFVSMTE